MRKSFYSCLFFIVFVISLLIPFNVLADEITDIKIKGFNEPVVGQKPKFNAFVSDSANYKVHLESWMGSDSTMLESEYNPSIDNVIDVFKKDVIYTYSIYIKPKAGYTFADNFVAKIDGITLDNYRIAGNTLIFEYEYGIPEEIDIEIFDVTMPIADHEPIYSGNVPNDANYLLYKEIWYDSNGDVVVDKFKFGEEYTYRAVIVPLNNANFDLPLYATVNGNLMDYESNEGNMYVFTYKYKIDDYMVVFDANGGKFSNGKELITFDNWKIEDENNISEPRMKGFKFIGFFTEKIGGTSFEKYVAEAGIDQDMTFYAQWEKLADEDVIENPDTGDNIMLFVGIGIASLIGIVGVTIYLMKKNGKRAK